MTSVAASAPVGAIGGCTTNWTGGAGNGLWATATNWDSGVPGATSVACIPDIGNDGVNVTITLPGSITVAGIDNSERIVQPAGATVTLAETPNRAAIVNRGAWRFAGGGTIAGTGGGEVETFENDPAARVEKLGTSAADVNGNVQFSNFGVIDVQAGSLAISRPGFLGTATYQVAAGASLSITSVNGVTQWAGGVQDLSGGGTMTVSGEVDSFGVEWAFEPGEATLSGIVDTTAGGFSVTGTLNTGGFTIRGDSFVVAAGGTMAQAAGATVTLGDGADVQNSGTWRFAGGGTIAGTGGGEVESFTNYGTVEKLGTSAADVNGNVQFSNFGVIDVQAGSLAISRPGYLGTATYQVAAGASLSITSVNGVTQWAGGVQDLSGGGTMTVSGEVDSFGVEWAFEPGEATLSGIVDTTAGGFSVTGTLNTGGFTIRGDSFVVAAGGTMAQAAGATVTLGDGADVQNSGTWRFAGGGTIAGTGGGEVESFTNYGTVEKLGTSAADVNGNVQFSNFGVIDVQAGSLAISRPGYLGTATYQVAAGASLSITSVNGVTQWAGGVQDLSGGGTMTVSGEVDSFGVEWAFEPGEATLSGIVDTTAGGFSVTGTLNTGGFTIRGDSFVVAAGGTMAQAAGATVTLDDGADVQNSGTWRFAGGGTIAGTGGGEVESFTNYGTVEKLGTSAADVNGNVQFSNFGTVHASGGSLAIANLAQISGTTLTGGTYFADNATITLPSNVTTIGFGATVHLAGTGAIPQVNGLTSNTGGFELSGGKDFTTAASLGNSGVMVTGPGSTLTVPGGFTNTGGTYRTEIAGRPATGQYGFLTATGAATLSGTFDVVTAPAFAPVLGDAYDVVRYASRNGAFDVHSGVAPRYTHVYDPGTSKLLRLTVTQTQAQAPVAEAGGPYVLDEGGPAVLLDGSASADPDGTIVDYVWTPATGLNNPAVAKPSLTPPNDNTSYDITLTVTDNDGFQHSDTAAVVVQNIAPVITGVTFPATASVGAPVTLGVTFTDQGGADTHFANVNWGDVTAFSGAATSPLQLQHTYASGGTYTVDVCVRDDDFGQTCTARTITVQGNRPPDAVNDAVTTAEDSAATINVLANDTDPDGDALTVSGVTQPPNGAAVVNANGSITFTPAANFNGTTSFTYTVNDGHAGTDTATVTVTVTAVNDAPVANAGADRTTPEGTGVTLLGSGTDVDSATLAYSWTPPGGLSPSAAVAQPTFTPADNGTTTFTLGLCDNATPPACDATPDTMTVTATNVAPSVVLPADRTVGVGVSTSVAVTFTDPGAADTHRAVIHWGDGTADTTVDPAASGFARNHTFATTGTFTVQGCVTDDDNGTGCDSMTVTTGNGAPDAVNDSASTAEDTPATINVLANDSDPNGDPLTVSGVTQPANGAAVVNANGSVTFTPAANFSGTTSFTYTVNDGHAGTDTATVTVTVTAVNDAPVANAGADRTTPEGTGVTLLGSGTDVDSATLAYSWTPPGGLSPSAAVAQPTFTPADNGTSTFTLGVCDNATPPACDATPDTMTVTATNVAPAVVLPADRTVGVGVSTSVAVTFTDPGAADTHRAVIHWGDGTADTTVDPAASGFARNHTFNTAGTFTVQGCVTDDDNGTGCDSMVVTIGGGPVAADDADTTNEDISVPIDVLANDSAPDDGPLQIISVTDPDHGSVTINDEPDPDVDTITYSPPLNYFGTATFTYRISDGHGGEDTATVTVTVAPINDEPVVVPGPDKNTVEGSAVAVSGTASDVDGPLPLSYHWSILEGPEVSAEPSGTFANPNVAATQFTPKQDGTYVLQLEACDAAALCDTDLVDDTVQVTVANVRPTVTLPADRTVTGGVPTSISATFTDPGVDDDHRAVIQWGDGTADTTVDPAVSPITTSHTFSTPGVRTVQACVTDDDDQGCDTMRVTVVPPTMLSIADASITEPDSGTAPMMFTITASPAPTSSVPVTVVVKTANGTATAPSDFTATPAVGLTVTFASGQSSKTFSVPIVGDLVKEPNESFTVTLSAPSSGATIGDGTATGRIDNDDVCTKVGTNGADNLDGTAGNDVICGLGGDDVIRGLGGNDRLEGGDGNDTLFGGDGTDTLRGDAGNDLLTGDAGNDAIDGGAGTDRGSWAGAPAAVTVDLTTNTATGWGSDTLAAIEDALGGAFNDTLRGNGLANALLGNGGNDTLLGRSGNDDLDGQVGDDTLHGDAGADNLIGADGGDHLSGGDGNDVLQGQAGNDELAGDAGNDRLEGADGNDDLLGGIGDDVLQGGNNNDEANGNDGNDNVQGNAGNDRVAGNNGNDTVDGGDGVDLVNGNAGNDTSLGGPGDDRSPNGATAGVHGGTGQNTVDGGTGTDFCSFGPAGEVRRNCELP